MNSDYVLRRRETFGPLFCRQIVWAIIEESREFFSQRLSPDDFIVDHPEDVKFARSRAIRIDDNVRDGIPIARSSFPTAWIPGATAAQRTTGAGSVSNSLAQVPTVISQQGAAASVVSGITATTGQQTNSNRPPVTIRSSNIHPIIKAAMEPYIAKVKGVWLGAMLTHLNLSIDDLPKLGPEVSGTNGMCYNFVLGRCASEQCSHKDGHVQSRDVTDEFATDIISKLRPAITEFMTNGLPPGTKRRGGGRRNRRRRGE